MNGTQAGPAKVFKDRRYQRFPIKVPVYIAFRGGTFRKIIPLESRDVSGGGVCFETSQRLPLHAQSRLVVSKLGDLTEPALIRGRVVHCEQDPATGRYTVGLEFVRFENVTREELQARVDAWAREGAGDRTPS